MPMPEIEREGAHDVLAAEAFAMPAPDPTIHAADVHDVLAAEMFAMPARDPTLHHGPVVLPVDLTGAREPRDVFAAEEFAMPAPPVHVTEPRSWSAGGGRRGSAARVGFAALGLIVVRRRLRRR